MTNPIHIDLRDLTPEKLAKCKPHMGMCQYSSPCVIGTLIPESEREELDGSSASALPETIGGLLLNDIVTMPEDQHADAIRLQHAFDDHDWTTVERIAAKWMGE